VTFLARTVYQYCNILQLKCQLVPTSAKLIQFERLSAMGRTVAVDVHPDHPVPCEAPAHRPAYVSELLSVAVTKQAIQSRSSISSILPALSPASSAYIGSAQRPAHLEFPIKRSAYKVSTT
jgi:hypothetical protein